MLLVICLPEVMSLKFMDSVGNLGMAINELSTSLEALTRRNCKEEILLCTKLIISDRFCDIIEQIEEPKLIKMLNIEWNNLRRFKD